MILKKFFRFTLSALLLSAGVSAYAQGGGDKVVTLANGESITWEEFVTAINNPKSITGTADDTAMKAAKTAWDNAIANQNTKAEALTAAKKAYDDAEAQLKKWQDDRSTTQALQSIAQSNLIKAQGDNRTTPVSWLKTASENANAFFTDFDAGNQSSTNKIYYKKTTATGFGGGTTLTVSFNELAADELTGADAYTEATPLGFYNAIIEPTESIKSLKVYFGKKNGNPNYPESNGILSVTSYQGNKDYILSLALGAIDGLKNNTNYTEYLNKEDRETYQNELDTYTAEINRLNGLITGYTAEKTEGEDKRSEQTKLQDAYKLAQTEKDEADDIVVSAKEKYDNEKAAYEKAVEDNATDVIANYKTVSLSGDVTATDMIKDYDGYINGNEHIITLGNDVTALFDMFKGTLANTAVNGKVFNAINGASFNNVASWAGGVGAYRDEEGNRTGNIGTLGQLGFVARNSFGVDFANNTLASLSDASKVYSITVYEPNSTTHRYVQTRENSKFFAENAQEYSIPTNMFAKSETYDLKGYANVFYDDNTCERAVIVDRQNFYCPADINVEAVELDREFQAGQNAVCLPFELNYDDTNIDALCTYDMETSEKFWFKKVAGPIPANKPVLLVAKNNFRLNLSNITIKKTDAQIVEDEGNANDPSKSFGLLKKATRDEIIGAYEAHKVYGLTKNGEFSPVAENVNFPAFRMVLYSNNVQQNNMPAPRRIGILDENGRDITGDLSGIEDLKADTSSLNIATGSGEIIFTSDADYGKVAIYTLDGKVAAEADVVAGTTTVSLAKGLYIVNGKKVMVK